MRGQSFVLSILYLPLQTSLIYCLSGIDQNINSAHLDQILTLRTEFYLGIFVRGRSPSQKRFWSPAAATKKFLGLSKEAEK